MRIRSIKPEFWRSEDITQLAWDDRLLFIGLWSYVDDNGVGLDKTASIAADLFAGDIELDPSETFGRVTRGLQNLSEQGRITRYMVEGKKFLHVTNWEKHQRIDKPNKPRYPLPTCGNAEIRESPATPTRESREIPLPGTGEQGNRGTGEEHHSSPAAPSRVRVPAGAFDAFWQEYPRKVGKAAAEKVFKREAEKHGANEIIEGARRLAQDPNLPEAQFIPHAATWLSRGGWEDEPLPQRRNESRPTTTSRTASVQALKRNNGPERLELGYGS